MTARFFPRTIRVSATIAVAALAMGLAGCQTTAERRAAIEARIDQRLASLNGMTMAEFSATTGVLPSNAYDGGGGRVFVIEGRFCRVLLQTQQVGSAASADSWQIVGASRFGGCDNLAL